MRNPFTRVRYPSRTTKLFRAKKTGRWGTFSKKNPPRPMDSGAARELELYIENDYELYRQEQAIVKNLLAKMKRGVFDFRKSVVLWRYLIDRGAKKYEKEYMTPGTWNKVFTVPVREHVSKKFAADFVRKARAGEYKTNPSKKHLQKDMRTFRHMQKELSGLIRRDLREKNPLTRRETASILRTARGELGRAKKTHGAIRTRAYIAGKVVGRLDVAERFGKMKTGLHRDITKRARKTAILTNPLNPRPASHAELPRLYARTHSITMQKGKDSHYPKQHFEHTFSKKNPVENYGLPSGSVVTLPSGRKFRVTTRSVLLTGKKNIWGKFKA